nr:pescadillo homolog [Tanacetum cinerariifolium]
MLRKVAKPFSDSCSRSLEADVQWMLGSEACLIKSEVTILLSKRESRLIVAISKVKKGRAEFGSSLEETVGTEAPHTVPSLYPMFIDALRDLDDCLTMVHLFAALPAIERESIQPQRIHNRRGLTLEWRAYISRTHKLRQAFIYVKGIYYQAEVDGQKVTWLTPHALQQVTSRC